MCAVVSLSKGLTVRQVPSVYLAYPVWKVLLSMLGGESIHCNKPPRKVVCMFFPEPCNSNRKQLVQGSIYSICLVARLQAPAIGL